MIKLTKKQGQEMYNKNPGAGYIIFNDGEGYVTQTIHLGRNGNWYAGRELLSEWLGDKAKIIARVEEALTGHKIP